MAGSKLIFDGTMGLSILSTYFYHARTNVRVVYFGFFRTTENAATGIITPRRSSVLLRMYRDSFSKRSSP